MSRRTMDIILETTLRTKREHPFMKSPEFEMAIIGDLSLRIEQLEQKLKAAGSTTTPVDVPPFFKQGE